MFIGAILILVVVAGYFMFFNSNNVSNASASTENSNSGNVEVVKMWVENGQYKFDGSPTDFKVELINAWPENVEDVALSYAANESVKVSVTFSYDFTVMIK